MRCRTLHVQLSSEATAHLDESKSPSRNLGGETLGQWLIRSFDSRKNAHLFHPSLFGTAIEVEEETPLLLEALAQIQNATLEVLIESWLMDPSSARQSYGAPSPFDKAVSISDESLGKVAQILDLGETLFEQTIADAQKKLGGSYAESKNVAQASVEVFRALRVLLSLGESNRSQDPNVEPEGS